MDVFDDENTHESSNSKTLHWLSSHWLMVVMVIVGGIVIIGVMKFITQMFNGDGPIQQGIGQALGAAANFVNGIVNGCTSQADCTKDGDKDSCNKSTGCAWSDAQTGDEKSSCLNTTGNTPGNRSLFSSSCVLGMGFIAYIAGSIVLGLVGWALKRNSNQNLETANRLSNKNSDTGLKDATDSARETAGKAKEQIDADNPGEKMTEAEKIDLGRLSGNKTALDMVTDAIDGGTDPVTIANQKAEAQEIYAEQCEEAQEQAEESGVDNQKHDKTKEVVDDVTAKKKGTTYEAQVNNMFNTYFTHGVHVSRRVFNHYSKKIKKRGILLHPSIQNGFQYYSKKYST